MSVHYSIGPTKNPKGLESVQYYSPKIKKTSDYDFASLAADVNNSTTVTYADCMAVLTACRTFIEQALLDGRAVILNGLGRFQIGLKTRCFPAETMQAEGFLASAFIKGAKINFRPESSLKKTIASKISYKRIAGEHDN